MRKLLRSQMKTDRFGINLRWLMLVGILGLGFNEIPVGWLAVLAGWVTATNILALRLSSGEDVYEQKGQKVAFWFRGVDTVIICLLSSQSTNQLLFWLFAVVPICVEALVSKNAPRLVTVVILAIVSCAISTVLFTQTKFDLLAPILTFIGVGLFAMLLSGYKSRDEVLMARDVRLDRVLECASALAASTDTRSLILSTLKAGVEEIDAMGGYVMLIDEAQPTKLVTEAAFSPDKMFRFPKSISVGTGATGYAVKTGQPLVIRSGEQFFDVEGADISAQAVISVPLVARSYVGEGHNSVENVLGAITFLGRANGSFTQSEDLHLIRSLASLVAEGVANARMEEKQRTTFLKTMESLAKSLEARDNYTRGHSQRVCEVSLMIAERLGMTAAALEELRIGTILHDIGKIGVPDAILNKPNRLTDEEFFIMKTHPVIGYEICRPLMLSEGVLMVIRNHHEKLDGSGYPDGLKGGELPLSLRIVCAADAFDAMSSRRPYRNVMEMTKVIAELSKGAGTQFDPVVVETLKELLSSPRMQETYRDQWYPEETIPKVAGKVA